MRHSLPFVVLALLSRLLTAQGVTTAAMHGRVTGENDSPLAGALVSVTNESNGRRWQITTPSSGRYGLEDVGIGGPYRIDVRALGFTPESRSGIVLALGQRVIVDFALVPAVLELPPLSVTTRADPVLSPSRTGPAEIISADRIAALPNLGRDLVSLTLQSPQASVSPSGRFANEAITIAGQNRGLNNFQVDGGTNFDLYGGRTQPGLQTFPRPISLEAVEEVQVLVAPVDVRHGGFVGGLVNSVTKSGTNAVRGSIFGFLTDGGLVGRNSLGDDADAFTTWQYGGTVGGPIVRDRAHFFLSLDLQSRSLPDIGPLITDTVGGADTINIGIRYSSAKRFQDILSNTYGLDPGTLGPYRGQVPAGDVLGKITLQLGTNSHLELSHHYTDGERTTFIGRQFGTYFLSSLGNKWPATVHASRAIWTSLLGGRWSNELIASYLHMRDACRPNVSYPLIRVQADRGMVVGGTALICPAATTQHALEVTENLSVGFGTHVWTVGAHAEVLHFEDAHLQGEAGLWNFRNLDSLAVGRAVHYERNLPGSSERGIEFRARQIGLYLQDRWQATRALTLTGGLRVDVPFLPDRVATNQSLLAGLGIDNAYLPSGDLLWSPRLGINYDVGGEGSTFLRGGIGLFSGRPLYQWIASSYRDDGTEQLFLTCDGAEVPRFDPVSQPGTCVSGGGVTQRLSFFDPDVRFPQSLKGSLGLDQLLPGGLVGTIDLVYTRTKDHLYFTDANLLPPVGTAQGEGNRPLYGTLSATAVPTPARRDASFGQVVRASNRSGDYSVSVAAQLRKQFGDRAELSGLYAYTRSRDRMSITTFLSRPNLETTPLDGTLENRRSRPSHFEIPHRVDLNATVRLPYRVRFSLRYAGVSGTAYSYTIRGDANADGIGNATQLNDIVYVPRDSLDIAMATPGDWATLNRFIENEPCLRKQRGRILARNSCRNPWFSTLSARVTKGFSTFGGQSLELTADLYNVLNLLNREWGQYRVTAVEQSAPMLSLVGYDAAAGRGVYRLALPGFREIQDLASRWQLELSARYVF